MRLIDRIDARERHELAALHTAMTGAEAALQSLEALEADVIAGKRHDVRPPYTKPLRAAWGALTAAVAQHFAAEATLYAEVRAWLATDGPATASIAAMIADAHVAHDALQQLSHAVQAQVVLLTDVRSTFAHALQALEAAHQVEEVEIFPAIDAGSRTLLDRNATPAPAQWRTSDDLARTLRTNRPAPQRESAPSMTLLGRLKSLFGSG